MATDSLESGPIHLDDVPPYSPISGPHADIPYRSREPSPEPSRGDRPNQPLLHIPSSHFLEADEDPRLLSNSPTDDFALAEARVRARARARFRQGQAELDNFRDRFNLQHPSAWKRILLLAFFFFMVWFAFRLRLGEAPRQEPVVHAHRYSHKFHFRPAASPVVSKKLPDGRTVVWGDDVGAAKQADRLGRVRGGKSKPAGKKTPAGESDRRRLENSLDA